MTVKKSLKKEEKKLAVQKPVISELCAEIGKAVYARRIYLNRSFEEVCRRSGCTGSYLSQLENGKMNVSVNYLVRLAHALGMTGHGLLKQATALKANVK